MAILAVEYFSEGITEEFDDAIFCPPLAIVYGWAYSRGHLSESFSSSVLLNGLERLNSGEMVISEFVFSCLDGVVDKRSFNPEVGDFLSGYLNTLYFEDVVDVFEAEHLFALPQDWEVCKKAFSILDTRLDCFKKTGMYV